MGAMSLRLAGRPAAERLQEVRIGGCASGEDARRSAAGMLSPRRRIREALDVRPSPEESRHVLHVSRGITSSRVPREARVVRQPGGSSLSSRRWNARAYSELLRFLSATRPSNLRA